MSGLRLLFVKESQNWPRSSGHDVHGFHMMRSLAARGHEVSLATLVPPTSVAVAGLTLHGLHALEERSGVTRGLDALQGRVVRYYGVPQGYASSLEQFIGQQKYDAVILVARNLLPLLTNIRGPIRIWYAADDPVWHHLSRVKLQQSSSWPELATAAINLLYERVFRHCYDRVWVVSTTDRRSLRICSGCRDVDVIANGVDAEHYRPREAEQLANSCVFWGRLDFAPNIDALEWFLTRIWPVILQQTPSARMDLYGYNPSARIKSLCQASGVDLHPDVSDLRPEVTRRQIVVLPFISGGGIKNKLLEAAAMAMPIACTQQALTGTQGEPPVEVCRTPAEWARVLARLWSQPQTRAERGAATREWVLKHHTWDAAAQKAEQCILLSLNRRKSSQN